MKNASRLKAAPAMDQATAPKGDAFDTHRKPASSPTSAIRATIVYMTALPLAAARAALSRLVDDAVKTHQRFEITRNGRRAAILMSADDFDSMQATIDTLADQTLVAAHLEGIAAIEAGDIVDADELASIMNEAGRGRDR